MDPSSIARHFDAIAPERVRFREQNSAYHGELERLCRAHVPAGSSVLELGCGPGDLLASLNPGLGIGMDISGEMVKLGRSRHPKLHFVRGDAMAVPTAKAFDAVIVSDTVGYLADIQDGFAQLRRVCKPDGKIILTYWNFLWQPLLAAAERFGWKTKTPEQNWLGRADLANLLELADFEILEQGMRQLIPMRGFGAFNDALAGAPFFKHFSLIQYFVARPRPPATRDRIGCTVVVPCRNERGNIADAVERIPQMGTGTEIIFVDGDSSDGTPAEIERQIALHPEKRIRLIHQSPKLQLAESGNATGDGTPANLMLKLGKGDAVRKGFAAAKEEVLLILDADLTVPPEDLPKFFDAIASNKGRFVNGTRLVYPMESESMKYFNLVGNKFFSLLFTWMLGQRIKDTLCGTKGLRKPDYDAVARGRAYFGDFDPFGDFDLLFGAARLRLPIVEVPVHYRRRTYGETKVRLVQHGILLLKMSAIALRKLKLQPLFERRRSG